jgi:LPS O-antigen subunit length determinant protein (WzzB/FepE family)
MDKYVKRPSVKNDINLYPILTWVVKRVKTTVFLIILVALLASGYRIFFHPVYQAVITISPSDIEMLNGINRLRAVAELPALDTNQAYAEFIRQLIGDDTKQAFFDRRATRPGSESITATPVDSENLVQSKKFQSAAALVSQYEVVSAAKSEEVARQRGLDYVDDANKKAGENILRDTKSLLAGYQYVLVMEIATVNAVSKARYDQQLAMLRNAVSRAKKAGIKRPNKARASQQEVDWSSSQLYLLGTIELDRRLRLLSKQGDNGPQMPELAALKDKLSEAREAEASSISPPEVSKVVATSVSASRPVAGSGLLGIIFFVAFGVLLGWAWAAWFKANVKNSLRHR